MKTVRLFLIPLLLSAMAASAQIQQAWVAKYNNGVTNGNHQALKILLDTNGNIYVAGFSANTNNQQGYATLKYAPNGNLVWSARYDSTNFPVATPTGFAIDNAGNVIVTGTAVTLKYDSSGDQLWSAPYNGLALTVDGGNNVYVAGVASSFTTVKLNAAGSNLWTMNDYGVSNGPGNLAQTVAVDSSSNVYVSGSEIGSVGSPLGTLEDAAIIKYNPNGLQLWKENYLGGSTVSVVGLAIDGYGSAYAEANAVNEPYVTAKWNSDGTSGWMNYNPTPYGASESYSLVLDQANNAIITGQDYRYPNPAYATYKIGTNGLVVWSALYPTSSYGSSLGSALALDSLNNVYVTGNSTITNTGSDIATLKYDSNGNQLWVQRYDGPGHANDAGNAIAVDNNGNVYVAGYETEINGSTEMVLIKYSPVKLQRQSNGNFILQAYGSPGESFDFQASTNLQTWEDLGSALADTNGLAQFTDTNASNFNARFYYTSPQ